MRWAVCLVPLFATACVTETEIVPAERLIRAPAGSASAIAADPNAPRPAVPDPATSGSTTPATVEPEAALGPDVPPPPPGTLGPHVLAETQPRGSVPYDNMTLPLVSPDGRFIATQTGLPPSWEAVLAEPGASVPITTRIEIYELSFEGNDPPSLVTVVDEPAILGRSCDDLGFLIEAPRANGARWIGRAGWVDGTVTWLVNDPDAVSAFATLGPDGRLAWSSRGLDESLFGLVVRSGDREWRLPAHGSDWLMPTWSGGNEGDGLYALMLRGDMLDAVHMVAADEDRTRRTIQRLPLANSGADRAAAYQTLNANVVMAGGPAPTHDRLILFHPAHLRAAVWEPPGPAALLDERSIAAVIDPEDEEHVVVVTTSDLLRRPLAEDRIRSKLATGTHVPRRTASPQRPYVLLEPTDGVINLTVMRLWPAGTTLGR